VDIVDIFRRSEDIPPIVDQALQVGAPAVWMQLGISNETAAQRCIEAGVTCIMDSCIKVEHARLSA
jgi:predicted CoA-binding protein